MLKGFFEKDTLWIKAIFIISFPLIIGILFSLLSQGILYLFHITNTITILKSTQLFSATGMFICASIILAYLFSKNIGEFLYFKKTKITTLILAILSIWIAIPLINFLGEFNNQIIFPEAFHTLEIFLRSQEEKATELTHLLLTANSQFDLFINLFIMAVIPSIGEEFLFRGVILHSCIKHLKNINLAIWITAFIFSAIHFQFYGFIPRLLLGAYLGYLLIWSKSIWIPIGTHFINNATIVFFYYFTDKKSSQIDIEKIGTNENFIWPIGSLFFLSCLIYLIYIQTKKQQQN